MKEGESLIRKNNRGKHVHGESQSDMLLFAPSHDQTPVEGEWMDGRPILIDVRENGQDTADAIRENRPSASVALTRGSTTHRL